MSDVSEVTVKLMVARASLATSAAQLTSVHATLIYAGTLLRTHRGRVEARHQLIAADQAVLSARRQLLAVSAATADQAATSSSSNPASDHSATATPE
jgi:hypothetical protein